MFWCSDTLVVRLPAIVTEFAEERIKSSSYELRLGDEAYVSPTGDVEAALTSTIRRFADGECFSIPSGQFAYLVTNERLTMPDDALGLISIRSRFKWAGLVNVSGFHVDPTYCGKLLFTVFNAGPLAVQLRVGEPMFHLWLAGLDRQETKPRPSPGYAEIPAREVISGVVPSYESLRERVAKLEGANRYYSGVVAFTLSVALLLLGNVFFGNAKPTGGSSIGALTSGRASATGAHREVTSTKATP